MKPLRDWDDLPEYMRTEAVRPYYDSLKKHESELYFKRVFDVIAASFLFIILAPIMLVVSVWIKLDSPGPVFFRQTRITQYGKEFRIYKFRTMVNDADKKGAQVTVGEDSRITKVGSRIRKYRIDEFPQLINVITGDMSFVGTRPEVSKFVVHYTDEMFATLLLPAGITSEASIKYKNENAILESAEDIERTYLLEVLPSKMEYNLLSIKTFSAVSDLKTMFRTVLAVIGKDSV